ncbi:hypothetical protein ACLB2K_029498 [Fragaria x ananassa]
MEREMQRLSPGERWYRLRGSGVRRSSDGVHAALHGSVHPATFRASEAKAWRKHGGSTRKRPEARFREKRRRRVVIGCGAKQTKTGDDRVKKRETERLMVKKLAKRKSRRSSPRRGLQYQLALAGNAVVFDIGGIKMTFVEKPIGTHGACVQGVVAYFLESKALSPSLSIWRRKKEMGKEGLIVAKELKRICSHPFRLDRFIRSHVSRLLKSDLLAVLAEFQRQDQVFLCMNIYDVVRKEIWYRPDMFFYRDMLMMLARNRKVDEAKQVWDDLKGENVLFDQHTFGDIIRAFIESELPSEAMVIYDEMRKSPEPPISLAFRVILKGFLPYPELREKIKNGKVKAMMIIDVHTHVLETVDTYPKLLQTDRVLGDIFHMEEMEGMVMMARLLYVAVSWFQEASNQHLLIRKGFNKFGYM